MKGNLHGFLLAALMIVIAVGGTAHHLATAAPEAHAPARADRTLAAGIGLLDREAVGGGGAHHATATSAGPACGDAAPSGATASGPACEGSREPRLSGSHSAGGVSSSAR